MRTPGPPSSAENHGSRADAAPGFPPGFFERLDESPDRDFYRPPRLVTHIDRPAIDAAAAFYTRLGVGGRVLDLMSSWVSHLTERPAALTILGMNAAELAANDMAHARVVHDLNLGPTLPFADASFDTVICSVSVDYLTRPVEVFTDVARVLVPGGPFACTFSNRCFPTKAVRGWLATDDAGRCRIVAGYFAATSGARGFGEPRVEVLVAPGSGTDPLYAVWAART